MTDSKLPGPLTDFSGRVPCDQYKMTLPVLADSIEHLKAFHVGQAVIEHHHIGGKLLGFTDTRRPIMCNPDFQLLRLKVILEVFGKELFVFDNQYFV
jgi:hypothetical protein